MLSTNLWWFHWSFLTKYGCMELNIISKGWTVMILTFCKHFVISVAIHRRNTSSASYRWVSARKTQHQCFANAKQISPFSSSKTNPQSVSLTDPCSFDSRFHDIHIICCNTCHMGLKMLRCHGAACDLIFIIIKWWGFASCKINLSQIKMNIAYIF